MLAQPAPPDPMVGPATGHDLPEARAMPKDTQMRKLVDHDGFESLGRGQHQAPRKRESPRPRTAAPACPCIADRDGGRLDRHGNRMALDLAMDRRPGFLSQP